MLNLNKEYYKLKEIKNKLKYDISENECKINSLKQNCCILILINSRKQNKYNSL